MGWLIGGGAGAPANNLLSSSCPAVDNAVARYDGITGKLVQESAVTIGDTVLSGTGVLMSLPGPSQVNVGGNGSFRTSNLVVGPLGLSNVGLSTQIRLDTRATMRVNQVVAFNFNFTDIGSPTPSGIVQNFRDFYIGNDVLWGADGGGDIGQAADRRPNDVFVLNSVVVGDASTTLTDGAVTQSDDVAVDANPAANLTVQASNKTLGSGAGGDVVLVPGTSFSGSKGSINASSSKILNVLDPTSDQEAATKKYVDDNATSDHGALTGLGDDDHSQYFQVTGRAAESLQITGAANLTWGTDGGGDIGTDGANRPNDAFVKNSVVIGDASTTLTDGALTQSDDNVDDASPAASITIAAGNKTDGDGDGGDVILDPGVRSGTGTTGKIKAGLHSMVDIGRLGINTTDPSVALEIDGTLNADVKRSTIFINAGDVGHPTIRGAIGDNQSAGNRMLSLRGSNSDTGVDRAEIGLIAGLDGLNHADGEIVFLTKQKTEPLREVMRIDRLARVFINGITPYPQDPTRTALTIRGFAASGEQSAVNPKIALWSTIENQTAVISANISTNAKSFSMGATTSYWDNTFVGYYGMYTGDSFAGLKDDAFFRIGVKSTGQAIGDVFRISTSGDTEVLNNLEVSGEIINSSGVEASPSYTFAGSLGTGMYSGFANGLDFAAGGSRVLEMQSNRITVLKPTRYIGGVDIGIGTEKPGNILLSGELQLDGTNGKLVASGTGVVLSTSSANAALTIGSASSLTGANSFSFAASTDMGFFGTTPVPQEADTVALTDSSTGTANDTVVAAGGVAGSGMDAAQIANVNDNFADLAAKYNALRDVLRAYGLMA
jgi:hypothetical protein